MSLSSEWMRLYEIANREYQKFYDREWFVRKSIPILYSGNLAEYFASSRKIVTVSLNPSCFEFREENAELPYDVKRYSRSYSGDELQRAYSSYFERRPYTGWFNSAYENILQCLDASYYGRTYPACRKAPKAWVPRINRVLHTDLCTPLVTHPNWSRLSKSVQAELSEDGNRLWREVISLLRPDLILISVGAHYRSQIGEIEWMGVQPEGLTDEKHTLLVANFEGALIVWGKQQVRPFFYFSRDQRRRLAEVVAARCGWATVCCERDG